MLKQKPFPVMEPSVAVAGILTIGMLIAAFVLLSARERKDARQAVGHCPRKSKN